MSAILAMLLLDEQIKEIKHSNGSCRRMRTPRTAGATAANRSSDADQPAAFTSDADQPASFASAAVLMSPAAFASAAE